MLEVSNGLRYVPVAKALKEHRPNQSEATFNLQWQRLFRVFFLCSIKKDPDKETTIYYSSSSNIRGFVILALAPRILVLLVKLTVLEAFGGNCIAFAQGRAAFSPTSVIRGRF